MVGEIVTREELTQVLGFQRELRDGLHQRITTVAEMVTGLGEQMKAGFESVTERQDKANGRTAKAEEAIEAVAAHGCANYPRHVEMIEALAAAGVVPSPGAASPVERAWTKRPAAKVGLGGALLGIGSLLPHLWSGLHWLAHLLTGVPQ